VHGQSPRLIAANAGRAGVNQLDGMLVCQQISGGLALTHRVVQLAHKYLAIADFAGPGCAHDRFGDFFDLIARSRDL